MTLIAPIAMEDGLRFAIREGGRTVGAGVVAKLSSNNSVGAKTGLKLSSRVEPNRRKGGSASLSLHYDGQRRTEVLGQ